MALPSPAPALLIEDRHGIALRSTRAADGSRFQWLPLAEMDPDLLVAFVALEDHRYFRHHGVDVRAVARAFRDNVHAGRVVSGASTISMQTARLLRPAPRSWVGKLHQALWALRLERHLSKQQILEQYLNRIPLGQGTIGVAAAAALYFDGSARDLSLGQAALLAGLAHAPSADNPLVSQQRTRERRAAAMRRLQALGHATAADVAAVRDEPLLAPPRSAPFFAPHFTTGLLLLAGGPHGPVDDAIWRTSLDLELQHTLEAEVRHTVHLLRARSARHAAAVVLDNPTGDVLAWVGSPDFWEDAAGQVDMVTSARQPGSALKPFLYALALDRGETAASILPDIGRTYETPTGPYRPRNYDRLFHGPVRLREALGSSFNVPAVELASRLRPPSALGVLHRAGFASLRADPEHYGLGIALGNGDVTLLELANGYRGLANGGAWSPVRRRIDVPPDDTARRIVSAQSAVLVLDMLADPTARVPGFGLRTPFEFPFPVAVKTGTSRHFTDNWAVAVTGRFTIAVWVGNFGGQPMQGVSGVSGAGPLLQRAVLATVRRYPPGRLPDPSSIGAIQADICPLSGRRPGAYCPRVAEWFVPGSVPADTCRWHRADRIVLPAEYTEWTDRYHTDPAWDAARVAHVTATADAPARFRIVAPMDGDRYTVPPGVDPRFATLALRVIGTGAGSTTRWYVDGVRLSAPRWRLQEGVHVVRAEAPVGHADEVRIVVGRP